MIKALIVTIIITMLGFTSVIAQAETKTFQFMFVNHVNEQLHFYVDDVYACTANAGMVCYSTVATGPHTFTAKGSTLSRQAQGTIYENADNPKWVICFSETGTCP